MKRLCEVAEVQTGIALGKSADASSVTVPYLRVANVQDGYFDLREVKRISITREEVQRYSLRQGDVLFTEGGDFDKLGRGAVWNCHIPNCVHQNHVFAVRVNSEWLLPEYLALYSASFHGKTYFMGCAKQTTNLASINSTQLKEMPLALPPLAEQKVIAAILAAWDRAIELNEKLIAAKQRRKLALMQQLLTGKTRLPGHEASAWKKYDLGEVASNSARRHENTEKTRCVYSVTNSVGMIPMAEDVIGESIERYKTVAPRDFAYNPMRINVGSIAMWQGTEEVLVSPDYVVFRCGPDLDADFLNHFRTTDYWRQFVNRAGGGSVRVRIYFNDLAEMPLNLPPIDEQKAIAAVLNTQDREIDLHRQKLDALRRQKKGLMQQLLTGKVRVNVPAEVREV